MTPRIQAAWRMRAPSPVDLAGSQIPVAQTLPLTEIADRPEAP
jgi:hypothetical protein